MKRIIYIFIVILITPFINGCTDLLDEENIRIPVADFYFTTEAGIEDATRAAYPFLRRYYGQEDGFTLTTFGTDIWLSGSDGGRKDFNNYGSGIRPGEGFLRNIWNDHYLGIAACNAIIDRAPEAEMNDDIREIRMGEAYFLRAVYYHILVLHWGAVPLELEETREVRTTATRAPESEVYAQIISDLEKAENMLPGEQPDYGRATSWAAKAMLARIYLTVENYPQAYAYAKDVIDNGPFSLVPDYEELWSIDNIRNSETIWSVQYTADERLNGGGNRGHLYFLMEYDIMANMKRDTENGRPWKRFMPSRFFVDMLQSNRENDSRFEKSWKFAWMANNPSTLMPGVSIGDTGVYVVPYSVPEDVHQSNNEKYVFFDIDDYFDPESTNGEVPLGKRNRYPSLNKFIDPLRPTLQHVNGQRDFVVTRLAEMYLIGAEAIMNEDPGEAADLINVIRRRAAWPGKEAEMEVSAGMMDLDFILDERARELCGEMFRWPDLKRTGKLIERVEQYNPDARGNIREYHLLRPIPTTMLDRVSNKEEFQQNPGY